MEPDIYRSRPFIADDHPDFSGHFPAYPVFPAVSQLDLVVALLRSGLGREGVSNVAIVKVKRAKFLTKILPGTQLDLEIKIGIGQTARWLLRDATQVCSQGELIFAEKT